MSNIRLLKGDCIKQLKVLKDNSVDSVVTDPPYEIGFMGKGWDDSGIANNPKLWKEVLRVLKPGGHLLSFSHSRTYHRQAVAVEDAGFDIRDQIMWIYGSGFPKSHNIGKSVDKLLGNEREVVGKYQSPEGTSGNSPHNDGVTGFSKKLGGINELTKGQSQYEGWGTALKPAHEPIVMARKPLSEKTVAKNVLEYGTGGINIDGCRVDTNDYLGGGTMGGIFGNGKEASKPEAGSIGRFPANIIFDEEAGKILDEQSGERVSGKGAIRKNTKNEGSVGFMAGSEEGMKMKEYGDSGGASRFFYCPKASKKDRNDGCDELEDKHWQILNTEFKDPLGLQGSTSGVSKNNHPTVKPTELMAYLIRLVTPKGGIVLDPFMGSGSTGKAAVREGMNFIGIEREKEYMEIAKTRIEHEKGKHKHREFFDAI